MSKRYYMNLKVDADLVRKAKVIAAAKQITLADYIDQLLRAPIENDLVHIAAGLMESACKKKRLAPGNQFPDRGLSQE
jgi:hypothetical protein